jgi:hypothetical protein
MSDKSKELAQSVAAALELIRLQHYEINYLKTALFALQESVASGKPPLPFEDAQRQVLGKMKESGHNFDDILPLLNEHLDRMRLLSK